MLALTGSGRGGIWTLKMRRWFSSELPAAFKAARVLFSAGTGMKNLFARVWVLTTEGGTVSGEPGGTASAALPVDLPNKGVPLCILVPVEQYVPNSVDRRINSDVGAYSELGAIWKWR